jgi:hypothetical protein
MRLSELMALPKPTFKIFIACENHAAFFQARRVQRQVEAWCGNDVEIKRVFWSFALLRNEELRGHAVREATEAEMIVISLLGNHELPPHVKRWVESWPARSQAGEAALVTLVGPEQGMPEESQAEVMYLRGIAKSRRLDFFCNRDGWERLEFGKPVCAYANGAMLARKNISPYEIEWRRGGINE